MKNKIDPKVLEICGAIIEEGGRPMVVGGFVRDQLLGIDSKDVDIEVYDMDFHVLHRVLMRYGETDTIGASFGVLKVHGLDVDFSLPRRENKTGAGHRGFKIIVDLDLTPEEAARRRDLTINSMSFDVASGEIIDPFNGQEDLEKGVLQATDPETFVEDPLRALRACQFAARFEFNMDEELVKLCSTLNLSELPGERLMGEFEKLFLKGKRPSIGLLYLTRMGLLKFFPQLEVMAYTPQDHLWHPEGDVWTHTLMVVDEAAKFRTGDREHDLVLMFGALCHDMGKPATTTYEVGGQQCTADEYRVALHQWVPVEGDKEAEIEADRFGRSIHTDRPRIRSQQHEEKGVQPAREFLEQLMAPNDLIDKVLVLVEHHLAPHTFQKNKAKAGAFRRLARKLANAGTSLEMLHKVATADHYGRCTPDAIAREYPAGDWFLERANNLEIKEEGPKDIVMGRHLIARGWKPGPDFGPVLDRCREVQYDTGWTDSEQILTFVLEEWEATAGGGCRARRSNLLYQRLGAKEW